MSKIGVFICHCGENISRTVDCARVAKAAGQIRGVAYATDYKYMCSDPGQSMIKKAVAEYGLTGIVVSACSPHMHEKTFRNGSVTQKAEALGSSQRLVQFFFDLGAGSLFAHDVEYVRT